MAGLKRNRYLECFYCGRKTSTRYDGRIRRFECPNCDATNYLDENGDITDPPVAATGASTPARVTYAVSRTVSPPSSPSGSIFCQTCLKNQHLFTASLAQYLPDDPDAPDYAAREREYYDYRKRMEKIYPQICNICEPKVRQRIEESAYKAKADVLRLMIDRSRNNKIITHRSWLDLFDMAGRWLWRAAIVLEVLSHTVALAMLGLHYCATQETASWACSVLQTYALPIPRRLPAPQRLLRWSSLVGLACCWWNPRFVQTVRGFTKHLVGLPKWYIFQLMLVSLRFFSLKFFNMDGLWPTVIKATDFGAHLLVTAFALLISHLAAKCVRVDTTPLFGSKSKLIRHPVHNQQNGLTPSKPDGVKNMSDLLDEIMQTPSSTPAPRPQQPLPPDVGDWGANFHNTSGARKPGLGFQSLSITEQPTPSSPPPSYEEEMDWSPTTSRHRAFSSFRPEGRGHQGFSQAPTSEEKRGAFWYRVPPAPTTPAQRMYNPPNQPRLRSSIVAAAARPEVSFREPPAGSSAVLAQSAADAPEGSASKRVDFAGPSFFPPVPENDPRNKLSDIFSESFTLRPSEEEMPEQRSWVGNLLGFGSRK